MGPISCCLGQAQQATLLDNWHDDSIVPTSFYDNRYNECWGVGINGHEYGIIGSTEGLHFIDVTNPTDVFEAFRVQGASSGTNLVHRDMKDYKGYLYCVADEGPSKLQIIDMNNLPNSVTQVYSSNEFVTTSHNLYIDTAQARLYLLGAGGSTKVLDISNPSQPSLITTFPNPKLNLPYTHDGFIQNNIGFFNCGFSGFWIVDLNDPLNPVLLSVLTAYSDAGYDHSGWLTPDGNYYVLCDETHGSRPKILDITDLENPMEVSTVEPGIWPSEIPHNVITRGNYAYFSYYYDGLEVWDVSNPANPQRAYYYDTYPGANVPSYSGAWGVNPNLPSGNILISDMQGGLFVFEALGTPNATIFASENEFNTCLGETVSFDLTVGDGFTSAVTLSLQSGSFPADVQFSQNPVAPGSTVQVTVNNFASTLGSPAGLTIVGNDGTTETEVEILIAVGEIPSAPAQSLPADNATAVPLDAHFEWSAIAGATAYKLQIADDLADFDQHIVFTANTVFNYFDLSNNLSMGKTYYWRVSSKNDCGQTASTTRSFTTEGVNAVGSVAALSLDVFPNPAKDYIFVRTTAPLVKAVSISLLSATGQVMLQRELQAGSTIFELPVNEVPSGVYLLKMTSAAEVLVQKIAVE